MSALYNEIDAYASAWTRNLIAAGHVAPGVVDERSIEVLWPEDVAHFTQAHFFAGIAGWSLALRLAGWDDSWPLWSGSCPCQSFSVAGKKRGFEDERHLWPAWFQLIRACRPPVIVGEQVASKDALAWLDLVFADLEGSDYTVRAIDLAACGVGAPHKRNRLYFYAYANTARQQQQQQARLHDQGPPGYDAHGRGQPLGRPYADQLAWGQGGAVPTGGAQRGDAQPWSGLSSSSSSAGHGPDAAGLGHERWWAGKTSGGQRPEEPERLRDALDGGDAGRAGTGRHPGAAAAAQAERGGPWPQPGRGGDGAFAAGPARDGDDALGARLEGHFGHVRDWRGPGWLDPDTARSVAEAGATRGFWRDCDWYYCRDGKYRPIGPGLFPLASRVPARVGKLRASGNAIAPPLAAEFIGVVMDELGLPRPARAGL